MSILVNQDAVLNNGGEGSTVSDFKTINGESIVGSGDLSVGKGGNYIWTSCNHFFVVPNPSTAGGAYYTTSRSRSTSNISTDIDNSYLMPFTVSHDITATLFGLQPATTDSTGTRIIKLFIYPANFFGQPYFKNPIFSSNVMDTWLSGQVSLTSCNMELKAGDLY
ncbi:MAG: hypothetical protein ACK5LJ_10520, partial [Paracoccus sp. (in: a-proteobacteria)]